MSIPSFLASAGVRVGRAMSIIRGARPDGNFYTLDKRISEDRRLGWAARGLLIYLLGKPDHWKVSIQALINETVGASSRSGRDAVYAMLGELVAAGYVSRVQGKSTGGRFGQVDYLVSEAPRAVPAEADAMASGPVRADVAGSPDTAGPHAVRPDAAKPTQTKTESEQERKRAMPAASSGRGRLAAYAPEHAPLPDWLPSEDWLRWCRHRRDMRRPLTAEAVRLQVRELDRLRGVGVAPGRVIDQSIAHGWTGLFAPRAAVGAVLPERAAWSARLDAAIAQARAGDGRMRDMGMIEAVDEP